MADVTVKSKPWYESVTVWGVGIALLGTVGQFVGYTISPEIQSQAAEALSNVAAAVAAKDWVTLTSAVGQLAGIAMALFGRNQAVQPVHFVQSFTTPVEGAK